MHSFVYQCMTETQLIFPGQERLGRYTTGMAPAAAA